MSNKAISDEVKYVKLKVIGGELPGSALQTKLGPMGIPAKQVAEDIKKLTNDWKSIKVHVTITIQNRKASVEITPSTSSLIVKALREPVRDRKKEKNILHNGSVKMIDIIEIARKQMGISQAQTLRNMVKCVLGTCRSVGCNVEGKNPAEMTKEIDEETIIIPEK